MSQEIRLEISRVSPAEPETAEDPDLNYTLVIGITALMGIFLLALIIILIVCYRKKRCVLFCCPFYCRWNACDRKPRLFFPAQWPILLPSLKLAQILSQKQEEGWQKQTWRQVDIHAVPAQRLPVDSGTERNWEDQSGQSSGEGKDTRRNSPRRESTAKSEGHWGSHAHCSFHTESVGIHAHNTGCELRCSLLTHLHTKTWLRDLQVALLSGRFQRPVTEKAVLLTNSPSSPRQHGKSFLCQNISSWDTRSVVGANFQPRKSWMTDSNENFYTHNPWFYCVSKKFWICEGERLLICVNHRFEPPYDTTARPAWASRSYRQFSTFLSFAWHSRRNHFHLILCCWLVTNPNSLLDKICKRLFDRLSKIFSWECFWMTMYLSFLWGTGVTGSSDITCLEASQYFTWCSKMKTAMHRLHKTLLLLTRVANLSELLGFQPKKCYYII